ncbi:MAG: hypothetical protein ACREJN_01295 [Nitrospiraceae bacterium]
MLEFLLMFALCLWLIAVGTVANVLLRRYFDYEGPDSPHDRTSYQEARLVRQIDGQETRLPASQQHIT